VITGARILQAQWISCYPSNSVKTLMGTQGNGLQSGKITNWTQPYLIKQLLEQMLQ